MVAQKLNAGFAPVRKLGKLPGLTAQVSYAKEYGEDIFEMQSGALKPGQTVVVLDDLIATGGSAAAAGQLVQKLGGRVAEYVFMVELDGLDGYKSLDGPVYSVFHFPA
ncbi:adenine phosphoribosyltransferase [Tieghemiomyces parasiticus]|nr:adenine phosphoribosyltransferase [Tieghemiomyces parasiticus]